MLYKEFHFQFYPVALQFKSFAFFLSLLNKTKIRTEESGVNFLNVSWTSRKFIWEQPMHSKNFSVVASFLSWEN